MDEGLKEPQSGRGRLVRWLLRVAAAATLLTNAYYLRFLEPGVSRVLLGSLLVLGGVAALVPPGVLPKDLKDLLELGRRSLVPLLLLAILGLGFVLREWGSRSGLPQSYLADEVDWVNRALTMIKHGDFNPRWWHHPTLHRYVAAFEYVLVFFVGVARGRWHQLGDLSEQDLLYWGRFVSVAAGTAAIAVTFALARRLFGSTTALLAALLLAVFPGAVKNAQFNKPDTLTGLVTAAAVLAILAYLDRGSKGSALAAGIVMGLAASAKYNAATVFLSFLAAVVALRGRRTFLAGDLYLGILGALLGFGIGCPYALADLPRFLNDVADEIHVYGVAGREGAEGIDNWATHAHFFSHFGVGLVCLLASLAGLARILDVLDPARFAFVVFPIVYYAHYSAQRIKHEATLVPLYPFIAILAAYAASEAARLFAAWWPGLPRWLPMGLLSLGLVAHPLARSVTYDRTVTRKDVGTKAREWIESTLPDGTRFAIERYCPVLDPSRYPVTVQSHIIDRSLDSYRREGVQYLIVTSFSYDRYRPEHHQTREYQRIFAACPLVQAFLPGEEPGPEVRILALAPAVPPVQASPAPQESLRR